MKVVVEFCPCVLAFSGAVIKKKAWVVKNQTLAEHVPCNGCPSCSDINAFGKRGSCSAFWPLIPFMIFTGVCETEWGKRSCGEKKKGQC